MDSGLTVRQSRNLARIDDEIGTYTNEYGGRP
jgi:hypothetical protein